MLLDRDNEKVSIIVPVYNVEKYIDQCMESICTQTYKRIEIVIVCDESTDDSSVKCRSWADKDQRIRLILNHQRKGLGAARNIGLRSATGRYIVYVDSDDWIKKDYIEKLYCAIKKTQANYVASVGFYEIKEGNHTSENVTLPAGEYSSDWDRMIVLLKEAPAVWKKIYDREWLISNGLFQPELFHYEDWGFEIGLVLQTEKILLIPEMGVFNRNEREGCLSNDNLEVLFLDFRRSIEFGLHEAKQAGILEKYRVVLQKYLLHDYCLRVIQATNARNEKALQILHQIKADILVEYLGYQEEHELKKCICFGSFSLRRIIQRTTIFEKNFEYYGFSGIISAMTQGKALEVENENSFRVIQVSQDISGTFGNAVDSIQEATILCIDFLEERNSILELADNQYITESEAYETSTIKANYIKNIIQSGSDEFVSLWKKKCLIFCQKLSLKRDMVTIVLVKSRMALQYGDRNNRKEFTNLYNLKQINYMISKLEDYFLDCCRKNGISVKEFDFPIQYYFTEEKFEYGCRPQYMNEALYTFLGFQIFSEICT